MEPLAVVTLIVAVLIIMVRGPLIIAPAATLNAYRRWISTTSRIRLIGGLMVLLTPHLIWTGREGHAQHGGIAMGIEGLGWFLAAIALWLIIAPGHYQRLAYAMLGAFLDPTVARAIGVFAVAIGLGLGWIALFVL
ncbi:MAG: hypothetical protein GY723_13405 [bacterium]|nr:hypothetical protein [bacterium]MCP5068582.1 hypothetical protein [bacterium]